ncbi:EpsG family protein, partial [Cytobacillus oceanisediminis]|uniref:EpsG family protein n=1 Tax=Cytobacillus oceanisediminis TaxID=665099 RepID=UPI001CCA232E
MLVYIVLPLTILYCLILSRILVKKTNSCTECYIARSNITLFIWAAILFGLAAFKGIRVGTDYPMYYYFFDDVAYEGRVELGISYIYQLAIINDSFLIFSSIIYFLIVTFLLLGIKKNCPNYLIGILFLVLTYVYFTSFNQLRQMLAVSLVFYGITLIISKKKNNKLKFIFIIAIALMFHNSAIFAFIFLLIPKVKYKPRIVIPLFLTTIALYFIPDVKNFIGLQVVKLSGVYAQKYANNLDYFFSINKEKGIIQLIPVLVQMIIV